MTTSSAETSHFGGPHTADDAFLSLSGVSKQVSNSFSLRDVSLDLRRGEILVIIGPSGSGKSTLLSLIAGFMRHDSGTITLDGRDLSSVPVRHRDVGMMFQNYALFPHLTVRNNVMFGLKALKVEKAEARRRYGAVMEIVQMAGYDDRYPAQLSGGQQQRIALARTLVTQPKVILFDEPLTGLDPQIRQDVRADLSERIQRAGVTGIMVSHDQLDAAFLGDRVAVMKQGEVQQVDSYRRLYESPATSFVAGFVGESSWLTGLVGSRKGTRQVEVDLDGQDRPWTALVAPGCPTEGTISVNVRQSAARWLKPPSADVPADGDVNVLRGRVVRLISLGSRSTLSMDVAGRRVDLDIDNSWIPSLDLSPGEAVTVGVEPSLCHAFSDSAGR